MSKIKFACVRCKVKGDSVFKYCVDINHTCCYEFLSQAHDMYPLATPEKYNCEEGFVTDKGGFLDRRAAMKVALENNQVVAMYKDRLELYSYMLVSEKR